MALPHGVMGWSAVMIVVFSDHTHLFLLFTAPIVCFCLICFFTSTQQSFSYAGRFFLGLTSTKLG